MSPTARHRKKVTNMKIIIDFSIDFSIGAAQLQELDSYSKINYVTLYVITKNLLIGMTLIFIIIIFDKELR